MTKNSPKISLRLITCPTSTPKVTPNGQNTPIAPLKCRGANSVRYIGMTHVIKPEINTLNNTSIINITYNRYFTLSTH